MTDSLTIDADATLWSSDAAELRDRPLLILLHGYGSNEHDLFGLRPYLPDEFVYASLPAPLSPPWPMPGRSWYQIEGADSRDPAGVSTAAEAVAEWADQHAAEASSVGLLGFSQGGAVSLQALRLHPARFAFAVNLSGYAMPGDLDSDAALAEVAPPVFWGRGSADAVIPEPLIAHTAEWLPSRVTLSGRVYPELDHSVSMDEIADVRAFLQRRLEH